MTDQADAGHIQIKQTMASTDDESGQIHLIDTISYENKPGLVPYWLAATELGWQTPERIVCLDGLKYQDMTETDYPADYLLNEPIPKSVLDGETDIVEGHKYVVVERPEIRVFVGSA